MGIRGFLIVGVSALVGCQGVIGSTSDAGDLERSPTMATGHGAAVVIEHKDGVGYLIDVVALKGQLERRQQIEIKVEVDGIARMLKLNRMPLLADGYHFVRQTATGAQTSRTTRAAIFRDGRGNLVAVIGERAYFALRQADQQVLFLTRGRSGDDALLQREVVPRTTVAADAVTVRDDEFAPRYLELGQVADREFFQRYALDGDAHAVEAEMIARAALVADVYLAELNIEISLNWQEVWEHAGSPYALTSGNINTLWQQLRNYYNFNQTCRAHDAVVLWSGKALAANGTVTWQGSKAMCRPESTPSPSTYIALGLTDAYAVVKNHHGFASWTTEAHELAHLIGAPDPGGGPLAAACEQSCTLMCYNCENEPRFAEIVKERIKLYLRGHNFAFDEANDACLASPPPRSADLILSATSDVCVGQQVDVVLSGATEQTFSAWANSAELQTVISANGAQLTALTTGAATVAVDLDYNCGMRVSRTLWLGPPDQPTIRNLPLSASTSKLVGLPATGATDYRWRASFSQGAANFTLPWATVDEQGLDPLLVRGIDDHGTIELEAANRCGASARAVLSY